jgi:diguanylate cyclase (GGDEF)-like protein
MDLPDRAGSQAGTHHDLDIDRLIDVVQQISLARSMDQITEIVRHEARELTGADGATFVLRQDDSCYYVDEDAISPLWKGMHFPIDACVSGLVMKQGRPIAIEDIYADSRVPYDAYRPTFVKSMLMVPIRSAKPVGAIGNYWANKHQPSDDEIRMLKALADSTAVAIENVLLYSELEQRVKVRTAELEREIAERKKAEEVVRQLAISDSLTSLLNRRGFFLQASQELKVARRSGWRSMLIFADLDGLKRVNDEQGHAAGDQMITDTAKVLRGVLRESDVLARIGGDEFVAFTLDAYDPKTIKERIRHAVEEFNDRNERPYRLSLSIGLVRCDPTGISSLEQLVEQADDAMYRDKRSRQVARQQSH